MNLSRICFTKSFAAVALCATAFFCRAPLALEERAGAARGDAPASADEARSNVAVEAKKAEIARLEAEVQHYRDEVAKSLKTDDDPDFALHDAKMEVIKADTKVKLAQVAAREYEDATYPNDEMVAARDVKIAEIVLGKLKEVAGFGDRPPDTLVLQKAEYGLKEAQMKLAHLQKYTRDAMRKQHIANIESAKSELLSKQIGEARIASREAARRRREPAAETRDRILSLLDDAVALQDVLLTRLRSAKDLQSKVDADPSKAKDVQAELKTLRVEIAGLASRADAELADALEIADRIRISRASLREKEAALRKAYTELRKLEPTVAPTSETPSKPQSEKQVKGEP